MNDDDGDRYINIGDRRELRHLEVEILHVGAIRIRVALFAIAKRNFKADLLAVAKNAKSYNASRRRLADHAPQLLNAFHLLAVQGHDHILLLHTGFPGWSILIHHGDFYATLFFEVEGSQPIRSDVASIHTQIRSAAPILAGIAEC